DFEAHSASQQAAEPPLEPGRGQCPPGTVGDRVVVSDLNSRKEVLIDGQEIGTAKIGAKRVDLLPDFRRKAKVLGIAKEISVFPEDACANALTGVVGKPGADRTMQSLSRVNSHPHIFGIIRVGGGCELDGAEQSGFD